MRELRPIVQRTVGAEGLLRQALADANGIEEAFIFGSYGTPAETPLSDIDVFVIGRPDDRFWEHIVEVQRTLGREINVKHYTRDEVRRLRDEKSGFIRSAFAGRRATLIGAGTSRVR